LHSLIVNNLACFRIVYNDIFDRLDLLILTKMIRQFPIFFRRLIAAWPYQSYLRCLVRKYNSY